VAPLRGARRLLVPLAARFCSPAGLHSRCWERSRRRCAGGFSGFGFGSVRAITITGLAALAAVVWGIACAYVSLFLDSFVVPSCTRTNRRRRGMAPPRPWIERHFGSFLLYGLFLCGLAVALGVGVVVVGLMTCCVGLLLVVLPYVGTVILLPFLVTYRAFSLEFLAQLDAGFAISRSRRYRRHRPRRSRSSSWSDGRSGFGMGTTPRPCRIGTIGGITISPSGACTRAASPSRRARGK